MNWNRLGKVFKRWRGNKNIYYHESTKIRKFEKDIYFVLSFFRVFVIRFCFLPKRLDKITIYGQTPTKNPETVPPPGFFNVKPVQTGLFKINSPEHTKDGGVTLFGGHTVVFLVFIILEDEFRNNIDTGSQGDFADHTPYRGVIFVI
jgi:hypothetical protein